MDKNFTVLLVDSKGGKIFRKDFGYCPSQARIEILKGKVESTDEFSDNNFDMYEIYEDFDNDDYDCHGSFYFSGEGALR